MIEGNILAVTDSKISKEENLISNMEVEISFNIPKNLLGQKEPTLRSWKRMLRRSNIQTSHENLPKT